MAMIQPDLACNGWRGDPVRESGAPVREDMLLAPIGWPHATSLAQGLLPLSRARAWRGLMRRGVRIFVLSALVMGAAGPAIGSDQEFPYDRELLLDAQPMNGSKRLP